MELKTIKPIFGASLMLGAALFVSNVFADAVVVEDVNADSIPDIVTTGDDGNQLGVFLGKGDGTFEKSFSSTTLFSISRDDAGNVTVFDQNVTVLDQKGGQGRSATAAGLPTKPGAIRNTKSDCWFSWPRGNVLNWWPAGCTPGNH